MLDEARNANKASPAVDRWVVGLGLILVLVGQIRSKSGREEELKTYLLTMMLKRL